MQHELKTWPEYFHAVVDGTKTFDIRRNDRDYKVGDVLVFKEWDKTRKEYTGRSHVSQITYLCANPVWLHAGIIVMAIKNQNLTAEGSRL